MLCCMGTTMVLLDVALFLLPYPVLLVIVPRLITRWGYGSPELIRSFRVTFLMYAGLIVLGFVIGAGSLNAIANLYSVVIAGLIGYEAFTVHPKRSIERRLFAALIAFAFLPVLLSELMARSYASVALLWGLNVVGTVALGAVWMSRTALSDRNKGRIVATAVYVVAGSIMAGLWLIARLP